MPQAAGGRTTPSARLVGALVGGAVAATACGAVMLVLRTGLQVRTIPERMFEWSLRLLSPEAFEAGLQRFGFDAKGYAFDAAALATLLVLAALGAVVLARGWSARALFGLGIGLWLLVMMVIMPLTDAGLFATALLDGTWNTIVGYLAVSLTYAATLMLARAVLESLGGGAIAAGSASTRRAALLGLASAGGALLGTYLLQFVTVRPRLPRVEVGRPQAAANPAPEPAATGQPTPRPATDVPLAGSNAPPTAAATLESTAEPEVATTAPVRETPFPQPRPIRAMKRDKDGAILPAGRRPGQLTEFITSNDDFYVVTKNAAGDPVLEAGSWRLRVDGEVARPIELDYANLRRLPDTEVVRTLECISNFAAKCELAPFGCDLISTARWRGVRLSAVLDLAGGVKPGTAMIAVLGSDEYSSAIPLDVALDPETLLVFEMNGEVLPREHGYPARLLVPGRYGLKNTKWVVGLRPMSREFVDWYGQRNWSREAIVKTMSRIDLPTAGIDLAGGDYNVAGVAFAGDRGVRGVEFSVDGGQTWQAADLLEAPGAPNLWVRWIGRFTIESGASLTLMARATDGSGSVQIEPFSLPQPDGSSGWPSLDVHARTA